MVLIAFLLRLAVIPFDTIENLMDATHLHAWEQGNVAASLLAGHGFGSPFQSDAAFGHHAAGLPVHCRWLF